MLEEKLFAALTAAAPEDLLVGLKEHAARELAPYRSRMGAVQLRQVEQPVCAEATAGALQPAAPQPVLYEPAMRRPSQTASANAQPPPQARTLQHGAPAATSLSKLKSQFMAAHFLRASKARPSLCRSRCPANRRACASRKDKRGYATAEVRRDRHRRAGAHRARLPSLWRLRRLQLSARRLRNPTRFKQAILRETLERGGVRAPEEIAVLAARSLGTIAIASASPSMRTGIPAIAAAARMRSFPSASAPSPRRCWSKAAQALAGVRAQVSACAAPHGDFALLRRRRNRVAGQRLHCEAPKLSRFERIRAGACRTNSRAQRCRACRRIEGDEPRTGRSAAHRRAMGRAFAHLSRRRLRLSRGPRRILPGEPLARRCARRAGDRRPTRRARLGSLCRRGPLCAQLTASFARVVAVESAPAATAALEENLEGQPAPLCAHSTLDFLRAMRKPSAPTRPDLIVVDPPRTGLGAEITALLAEIAAPALVYVSCDPATLARDLRALIASGYAIQSITLADLFPQTFHLETVVQLRRA